MTQFTTFEQVVVGAIIFMQVVDTILLFYIKGIFRGYEQRIESLEEWRNDLSRRI